MSFTQATINRILELCEKNHITPNKLSELSTVPVVTLFALLNNKVENHSSKNIYKICAICCDFVACYSYSYFSK